MTGIYDLHNNIKVSVGVSPIVISDDTPIVTGAIDTAGYLSTEFLILAGVLADAGATFTVLVEDSTTGSGSWNAVTDDFLLGTEAGVNFTQANDGIARKIGYNGKNRYVRCTVTPAGNASSAPLAIAVVQGSPKEAPVA